MTPPTFISNGNWFVQVKKVWYIIVRTYYTYVRYNNNNNNNNNRRYSSGNKRGGIIKSYVPLFEKIRMNIRKNKNVRVIRLGVQRMGMSYSHRVKYGGSNE